MFSATYEGHKLAEFLNFGWEISYGAPLRGRLEQYLRYGMSRNSLVLGVNEDDPALASAYTGGNGFGGIGVYNVTGSSASYLFRAAAVKVLPNCLTAP